MGACGPSSPSTGTIKGQLLTYGGLSVSPQGRPFDGHVTATDANGRSFVTSVPLDGNFVLQVPKGTYTLTGSSPRFGSGQ